MVFNSKTRRLGRISNSTSENEIDFIKYIPLATATLIVIGVSKQILFYGQFNIRILSFLEFNEIITSFLDYVVSGILAIIVGLYLLVIILTAGKFSAIPKKYSIYVIVGYIIGIVFGFCQQLWPNTTYILIVGICVVAILLFTLGFLILYRQEQKHTYRILFVLAFVIILSESILVAVTEIEYRQITVDKSYIGVNIRFKDEIELPNNSHTIVSDSSNYYIGKTNNYIFVHYTKENRTTAYPMENVLEISFVGEKDK